MRIQSALALALLLAASLPAPAHAYLLTLFRIGGTGTDIDGASGLSDGTHVFDIYFDIESSDTPVTGIFLSGELSGGGTLSATENASEFVPPGTILTPFTPGVDCSALTVCAQWDLATFGTAAVGPWTIWMGTVTITTDGGVGTLEVGTINAAADGILADSQVVFIDSATYEIVPEPGAAWVLPSGALFLLLLARRRMATPRDADLGTSRLESRGR